MIPSSVRDLYYCISTLGFSLGWRYWKLQRLVMKNPNFVYSIAFHCRVEANKLDFFEDDEVTANALREWADQLEQHKKLYDAREISDNITLDKP